jgi:hypothetical protein
MNIEREMRYRCLLCDRILDEHRNIIPMNNKEEVEKYKNTYLKYTYCNSCNEYILWETEEYYK